MHTDCWDVMVVLLLKNDSLQRVLEKMDKIKLVCTLLAGKPRSAGIHNSGRKTKKSTNLILA